jgi:2-dehydropantoate 2-reductase
MVKGSIESVYILGLGAMGGMYAAKLYDWRPESVKIIVSPARRAALERTGITINGRSYTFHYVSPEDQPSPADLVIVAVKSTQLAQGIRDIRGFIGNDTVVLSLLNGISSEEMIGGEIGMEHLLYAYGIGMDAVREGSAIRYTNPGRIVFGEKNNAVLSDRVLAIRDLFERAQIPCQVPADMQRALWSKFMMNTGINQVSAVLKAPYGLFQQNEDARKLMLMASQEVLVLSRHCGIDLDPSDVDEFVRVLDSLDPAGKTSMLQDIEAGRKSEVDLFAGTVVGLGKKYGVPTPVNETLLRIIRVMEGTA